MKKQIICLILLYFVINFVIFQSLFALTVSERVPYILIMFGIGIILFVTGFLFFKFDIAFRASNRDLIVRNESENQNVTNDQIVLNEGNQQTSPQYSKQFLIF